MDLNQLKLMAPWEWPADTGAVLHDLILDPRNTTEDRIQAAGMAGELVVMNDRLARLLISVAETASEPEELRGAAAISLGAALEAASMQGFDDEDDPPSLSEPVYDGICQSLQQLYDDKDVPKLVRRRALEAAVRAEQDWHSSAIRAAWSSGDEEWMLTAAFAARYIGGLGKLILEMLKSPNQDIQFEAILAAGSGEVQAAWPHIAKLLRSRDTPKPLMLAAIESAPGVNPEEAERLLEKLTESKDEDIASAAEEALMMAQSGGFDDGDEDGAEPEERREWLH